ncbi:MAG: bifunctional NADP-dependent methylenetetrahydromethanopterin dehydrogenase/methylenetetrahydrofolate dehydrogenase, partial [Gemmataceae bacterium]|nr:bifunctional NADP-dependent methylenetetrahydromethanopterin dehydrogenase/methylenetetrahydrofolate dehydrogenase [Gemmataceae bacterium]
TGPVGQRVARLLARAGGSVLVGSRQKERAEAVCAVIRERVPGANIEAVSVATSADAPAALDNRTLVVAAGAAGAVLLPRKLRAGGKSLKVAIDLNGVPPAGVEGVELTDKGADRDGHICYGALGVGGTKMKVHRAAVQKLFETNTAALDAEEIYDLALAIP